MLKSIESSLECYCAGKQIEAAGQDIWSVLEAFLYWYFNSVESKLGQLLSAFKQF